MVVLVCACAFPSHAQDFKPAEIAPGITLPVDGDATVFGLDNGPNGPVLIHLKPGEVLGVSHAGTNFLRSMVYAGPHMSFEVEGQHAQTVLASTKAVFFVRSTGENAEIMRTRVHLLSLQPSKKRREITDFSTNIFGGQHTRNLDDVPASTEMVPGSNWLKITPKDPLLPGEFAVAFLPKDVNQQPDSVFDFSLPGGSASPGNPYASQPDANTDAKKP